MASALTAARYQQVNTEIDVCVWIAVDCYGLLLPVSRVCVQQRHACDSNYIPPFMRSLLEVHRFLLVGPSALHDYAFFQLARDPLRDILAVHVAVREGDLTTVAGRCTVPLTRTQCQQAWRPAFAELMRQRLLFLCPTLV